MAIKPPGTPPVGAAAPVTQVEGGERAQGPRPTGFSERVGAAAPAPPVTTPVDTAVQDVARAIQAGKVDRGQPAVDAVIARLVELQSPAGATPRETRARIDEAQLVLGDDPGFVMRVGRMLDRAMTTESV